MVETSTSARLREALSAASGFETLSPEAADAMIARMAEETLSAGDTLFSAKGHSHGLCFVLNGELSAVESAPYSGTVRTIRSGESVDELQILAGVENSVLVEAASETEVAWISGADVDELADAFPEIRAGVERLHRRQLLTRLHTVLGPFDREFLDLVEQMADWVHLSRGELLFEQHDRSEGIYLVISGRLRTSAFERNGKETVVAESGRGEVVGELAFFGATARDERVRAVRDSVAVGFTGAEFEKLVSRRPEILRQVTRTFVERMHRTSSGSGAGGVTNVAIIAITPGVALDEFAARLVAQLQSIGRTLHVSSRIVGEMLDERGIADAWSETEGEARLLSWLEARESSHRFVVYQADADVSMWTRRCVRQADRVILVADANAPPELTEIENSLSEAEGKTGDGSRILVLVHRDGTRLPSGTDRWLAEREVTEHYHLRWDRDADFGRISRVLAGKAIGLVLGGGGARGFAHVGVIRALEEAGIPIDMIGGTSMGATVAAQYAVGCSPDGLAQMLRRVYLEIKPQNEYTLPLLSVVGTSKAHKCGVMVFGDTKVEDTWIPFFCVSSNLTTSQMVVHRRGLLRIATIASASLPGFVPPVVEGRELLVDGALLDNVPTDVMRKLGCGIVIASEVSVEEDSAFTTDRIPTNWELIRGKFRRKNKAPKFPSLVELAVRASLLHSSSRQNESVANADFCFRPPIEPFGMIDFLKLDQIVSVGYEYASGVIPELRQSPSFQASGQQ